MVALRPADAVLRFLADRAGRVVLEASDGGLFLAAPAAFDRYVRVQLERVLPQGRVSQVGNTAKEAVLRNNSSKQQAGDRLYLSLAPLAGDPLRWAAGGPGRQVTLHLHRGSCVTLTARTADGSLPPGRWLRLPAPRPVAARLGRGLPVGGDLEYADAVTLSRALEGRKEI